METEKTHILPTILLVSLIIIIFLLLGIIIYNAVIKETEPAEIEQISTENVIKKEGKRKSEFDNKTTSENTTEENLSIYDPRVTELVDIFNNSYFSERMRSMGATLDTHVEAVANISGLKIIIYSSYGYLSEIEFKLDNNILSTVIPYNENDKDKVLVESIATQVLIDCIGQMKGYPENEVGKAIGKDESQYYTLENDGIETVVIPDTYDISVKIDLDSDFPFMTKDE